MRTMRRVYGAGARPGRDPDLLGWRPHADPKDRPMAYPPEFLKLVDQFIALANQLAQERGDGEVSAAILFAAGRYNAFNFLSRGGQDAEREKAVEFYSSEYRKALVSNLDGVAGPVMKRPQ
jgi:hypothetical protein